MKQMLNLARNRNFPVNRMRNFPVRKSRKFPVKRTRNFSLKLSTIRSMMVRNFLISKNRRKRERNQCCRSRS